GPHLLAVDDPILAVFHRTRLERGDVRTRAGFGKQLAPDLLAPQRGRDIAFLGVVVGEGDHRRDAHAEPDRERAGGRIELAFLLTEDHRIDRREPAPALLLGPGDAGKARFGLGLLVRLSGLEIFLLREPALQAILVVGLRLAGLAQKRTAFFA